jgi:hypothetical protein
MPSLARRLAVKVLLCISNSEISGESEAERCTQHHMSFQVLTCNRLPKAPNACFHLELNP